MGKFSKLVQTALTENHPKSLQMLSALFRDTLAGQSLANIWAQIWAF